MVDATGNTERRLLGAANKVQVASEVAESMLRKAAQWLMWKAIAVISAATLSKCLFAWMAVWVEQQDLGRIAQQFDELQVKVKQLQGENAAVRGRGGSK